MSNKETSLRPSIALTVDVEDYFQVASFEGQVSRESWDLFPSRVEANTMRLLDLFSAHGARATFFVLGWVGERYPALVREIYSRGHEVASHGYWHRRIHEQGQEEFREDIRKSKKILENITGSPISGYRAPTFSITPRSKWAYPILAQEDYRYSSSVYPIRHDRYGWPGFGSRPRPAFQEADRVLWEFPLPFLNLGGLALPFGGGGYLRIYPFCLTKALLRKASHKKDGLTVCYVHPWELDPAQPRIEGPFLVRARHHFGIKGNEGKLRKILRSFSSKTLGSLLPTV